VVKSIGLGMARELRSLAPQRFPWIAFPRRKRMQIKLAPDLSLLAIMVIFIINYLIVRKFFLQPINQVIDERETETRTAAELYEAAMTRFNEATAELEARLHEAKREGAAVRDRFRADAATRRNQVLGRTQGEAKKIVAEAETKLGAEVKTAREKIARESDSLARLAAERILGRPL
jgi:F0F1-type ATP synthase membrane subunit b/b'